MAMPIQILAKPMPESVRRREVTGTISADTNVLFSEAAIESPPFEKTTDKLISIYQWLVK